MVESADLAGAMATVRGRVADACARVGRDPLEVRIVAVTKGVSEDRVRAAFRAGMSEFGENYVQDLVKKRAAAPDASWHFIGRLQSNKVKPLLWSADVVQTLEPGRATDRLVALVRDEPGDLKPIEGLVEVDFTGRRVGAAPADAVAFAQHLARERIQIRGLMTVAPLKEDPRVCFRRLRELRDELREHVFGAVELSMGMSSDYEVAVEEGATMIRVGAALFGPRR